MTYGDEQAEARRLHSILNEGEVMTPQPSIPDERPDPVAVLATALYRGYDYTVTPREIYAALHESGYVLVNADMLARALQDTRHSTETRDHQGRHIPFDELQVEHQDRKRTEAAAILAALEKQP